MISGDSLLSETMFTVTQHDELRGASVQPGLRPGSGTGTANVARSDRLSPVTIPTDPAPRIPDPGQRYIVNTNPS